LAGQQEARLQNASITPVRLTGSFRASEAYREGVVLASGLTVSELKALVAQKFSLLDIVDAQNMIYELGIPPGIGTPAALELVRKVSPLIVADFDHIYTLVDSHNVCEPTGCRPFQAGGWGWPRPLSCGKLPTIGMIDTAIDPESKLFASATIVALGEASTGAKNSHGTQVASLLAAATETKVPDLLPNARLIVYNAFASQNGREVADTVSVVRAISSLIRRHAKVINMSLVGPPNLLLEQAVKGALEQNTVIVAAAGNEGTRSKPAFPAAYDGVIAVTAVDDDLKGYEPATRGSYITLAAPGVRLLTADSRSGSNLMSGASYAAPFVTAAAALLLAAQPKLSPKQVADALIAAARDIERPGRDDTFGWGFLRSFDTCKLSDQQQNADRITQARMDARR
jgi:subtilisin family serine protease